MELASGPAPAAAPWEELGEAPADGPAAQATLFKTSGMGAATRLIVQPSANTAAMLARKKSSYNDRV